MHFSGVGNISLARGAELEVRRDKKIGPLKSPPLLLEVLLRLCVL